MYSRQQLQQVTIYSAPHVLSRFFPACPDLMPDHFPMCSFQKVPYLDTPLYAQHPPYILLHALPAGKGGFCIRLLHSIGAADIDLDDAWGSETFDSSDITVPKQAAEGLDDLSAAPKAKAHSVPVKPKVSGALGTGTPTAVCNAAAERCTPFTFAESALLHSQASFSCTTAAILAARPLSRDFLLFMHGRVRVFSETLPATAVFDMEMLSAPMQRELWAGLGIMVLLPLCFSDVKWNHNFVCAAAANRGCAEGAEAEGLWNGDRGHLVPGAVHRDHVCGQPQEQEARRAVVLNVRHRQWHPGTAVCLCGGR